MSAYDREDTLRSHGDVVGIVERRKRREEDLVWRVCSHLFKNKVHLLTFLK